MTATPMSSEAISTRSRPILLSFKNSGKIGENFAASDEHQSQYRQHSYLESDITLDPGHNQIENNERYRPFDKSGFQSQGIQKFTGIAVINNPCQISGK